VGKIVKKLRHLVWSAEVSFRVATEEFASVVEAALMAQTSEYICDGTLFRFGVTNAVGRKDRKLQTLCDFKCSTIAIFLIAFEVSLQFNVDIFRSEDADQFFCFAAGFFHAATFESSSEWAFFTTCQTNQTFGMFSDLFRRTESFSFRCFAGFVA